MPRGKPARKRPASASAERQTAQSSKRRHTGRSTANPVPAVEDNINAVSNSAPATNEATDAFCTPSLDSASVNGPGSSIQGSTAGIFQVTDPHHRTEARFLLQDQLNRTEPDSLMYPELQGLGFSPINVQVLAAYLQNSDYDKRSAEFLIRGFVEGFKINYTGPRVATKCSNLSLLEKMSFRLLRKFLKKFMLAELQDHLEQDLFLIYVFHP
eukprot:XP_019918947.1 PREDICTED: uncharacterized protein LOC105319100 [Crassostrea gigas]